MAASVPLSESRGGFTSDFLHALPASVRYGFDHARDALMILVGELLGTDDRGDTCRVILVAALPVAIAGYLLGISAIRHTTNTVLTRWIVAFAMLFHVTLLMTPGLLSTDAIGYAVFGRLGAVHGVNPYTVPVPKTRELYAQLEPGPLPSGAAAYTTPYGPLWTSLSTGLAQVLSNLPPLAQVLAYRVLGSAAVFGCMAMLWLLLAKFGSVDVERSTGLLLFAWNPLVLFELIANAHNDGFMLMLALGGMVLMTASARLAALGALVMFALAALVKFLPLILIVFGSTVWIRSIQGRGARVLAAAGTLVVVGLVAAALAAPWTDAQRPTAIWSSALAGNDTYVNVIWDLPTSWIASRWVDPRGEQLAAAQDAIRAWPQTAVRIIFVAFVALEARRLWVIRLVGPTARTKAIAEAWVRVILLGLLIAFNQVLTWYYVWPLTVAAALGWRSYLCRLTIIYSVCYLLLFYAIRADLVRDRAPWLLVYELGPLVWLVLASRRGPQRRSHFSAQPAS